MTTDNHQNPTRRSIKIWDLPTRLFHWSLVLLIVFLWYSGDVADDMLEQHMLAGRAVLALVIFRLLWGFVGSATSRFRHFVGSPVAGLKHLFGSVRTLPEDRAGHNPAGAWMILLLLLGLTVQAGSGLFTSDDFFYEGPLNRYVSAATGEWMTDLHHLNFEILLVLIGVHVAAVLYYLIRGRNLIGAMLTGRRVMQATDGRTNPGVMRPTWLALVLFGLICGAVFGLLPR